MRLRRVTVCFDKHRPDQRVAAVRVGRAWHLTKRVILDGATLESVYKGPTARNPKFYFTGMARVRMSASAITLSA